jgi:hypothetical protein
LYEQTASPLGYTDYGYHIDHINGAHDDRISNGRVLCVGCHRETPSYGRGSFSSAVFGGLSNQQPAVPAPSPNAFSLGGGLRDALNIFPPAPVSKLGIPPAVTPSIGFPPSVLKPNIGVPPAVPKLTPEQVAYVITYALAGTRKKP